MYIISKSFQILPNLTKFRKIKGLLCEFSTKKSISKLVGVGLYALIFSLATGG